MKPVSTSPELGAVPETARNSTRNFVDLDVTGMTCAASASRIERKLNKLDGVTAAVNYRDGEGAPSRSRILRSNSTT